MPRLKRNFLQKLTRAEAVERMADPNSFECVDDFQTCAILNDFPVEDRQSMINAAWEIINEGAYEQGLRVARLRLADPQWPIEFWPQTLRECPELEKELTPAQAVKLAAARLAEDERILSETIGVGDVRRIFPRSQTR